MLNWFRSIFNRDSPEDKVLRKKLHSITGICPLNLNIYKQALRHDSVAHYINKTGLKNNNERLEFLGDAVLSAVVAEMVFLNYPFKREGFLTKMRSKLVSREMLNSLARKTGLHELLMLDKRSFTHPNGIDMACGNAMEAIIGAIFLDKGFITAKKYIIFNLINHHVDIEKLEEYEDNYKSRIYEWSQAHGKKIAFQETEVVKNGKYRLRKVIIILDGETIAESIDHVKKKAEQEAARLACIKLNIL